MAGCEEPVTPQVCRLGPVWSALPVIVGALLAAATGECGEVIRCVELREPVIGRDERSCVFASLVASGPNVDGVLDDDEWKDGLFRGGFVEHQSPSTQPIHPGQTELCVAYSQDALYVAVKCQSVVPGHVRHECDPALHDGDVFHDDCIEIVLVVASSEMRFAVSASAARADSLDRNADWNPAWVSAVSVGENEWTAEIAIPFSCLEGRRPPRPDDPGSSMRFNVCRSTAPVRLVSSLFPGCDDQARMGWLVVGTPDQWKARARMRPRVRFDDVALLLDKWAYDAVDTDARGRLRLVGAGPSSDGPESIRARLSVVGESGGKPLAVVESAPLADAVMDFAIDVGQLPVGQHRLRAELLAVDDTVLKVADHPLTRTVDPPLTKEGAIPVVVDFPEAMVDAMVPGSPVPVYAGVPLPRTVAAGADDFQLYDRHGRELPCQAEPITRWSPQGGIQWLGVRFLADSADLSPCELRYGGDHRVRAQPSHPLQVTSTDLSVLVSTGPLRFEVLRQGFDGVHRAWFDADADGALTDEEQVIDDESVGPFVVDEAGKTYYARLDDHAEVSVESSGPISAVIRCAGWYVADDGGRICKYVSRIVAHAGLPWVRVFHTLVFCADSRETAIADVAWPTRLRAPTAQARFGGDPRPVTLTLGDNEGTSLLQHESDAFALRRFSLGPDGKAEVLAAGVRAGGWAEATGHGVNVAVGLRDFAETYPRELEVSVGEVVLHLWPAHGFDKPIKRPTEADLSELWFLHHRRLLDFRVPEWFSGFQSQGPFPDEDAALVRHRYVRASATTNGMGVALTSEFFINFRSPDRDNVRPVWASLNHPPLAYATPEWMCSSGAFGPLEPVDRDRFPLIEQALDVRHDGERSIERFSVGMFNYGGSTSYFQPEKRSYDQLDRPWRLTHHGSPRVPWLLFARSGNRKFADYALRHGAWCADLAFCHYSTPRFEKEGMEGKIRGGMCDYKGIVPWSRGGRTLDYNSMADFLVWMACISGNRWPLEVAEEWGQCTKQRFGSDVGRKAAGTLDTLLTLYELTWDMDYRELAERQFLTIADREFLPSGHFRHGIWYDYAPWLAHYHRFTSSERAADIAVRWSDRVLKDTAVGDGELGGDTKFVSGMGYPFYDVLRLAFEATGDPKYLDVAFGCSLLPALSTVADRRSPYYGVGTYSAASFGGYYTQTVPYVLPSLAKHSHGRAVFPPWTLRGRKLMAYVLASGDQDLELHVHLVQPDEGREASSERLHVKFMDDRGQSVGPMPVELVRDPLREQHGGVPPEGENDHGRSNYARLAIPRQMLGGTVAILLAYPRSSRDLGVRLPVRMSRAAKVVFAWNHELRFGRGSAVYFQPARRSKEMVLSATASNARPHMVALLDGSDGIRIARTWAQAQGSGTEVVRAPLQPGDDQQVWCCLQGLTKELSIKPATDAVPPFFSDRPERFFVPDTTASQRSKNR